MLCLSILCSCGKDEPDLGSISEIPGTFLEAVKNLDRDAASACSPELDTSEWDEFNDDQKSIMKSIMAYAEITEMGDPVFYEESGCADLEVTLSYISLEDVLATTESLSVSEYLISSSLEKFNELNEKNFKLEFEYDAENACWNLTKSSARKIYKLFSFDLVEKLKIVDYPPEEASDILMSYLNAIAECTDADAFPDELDLRSYRYYDDSLLGGEGSRTEDAVARFALSSNNRPVRTNAIIITVASK